MSMPIKKKAVYDDLFDLPENMTGEIIRGELHAIPRPHYRHANTISVLGSELIPPYRFGKGGGPGGWVIIIEPEIMLGENLLVPDLAGWKKERLPKLPKKNWTSVAPDWVCEILSPHTRSMIASGKCRFTVSTGSNMPGWSIRWTGPWRLSGLKTADGWSLAVTAKTIWFGWSLLRKRRSIWLICGWKRNPDFGLHEGSYEPV